MSDEKDSVILVDLDSLFDTRFATLCKYDFDLVTKLIETKSYHLRVCDSFDKLKYEDFRKLYEKRDKKLLSESLPTTMHLFIESLILRAKKTIIDNPIHFIPKLDINIYPYDLLEEEKEVIKTNALISFGCDVKIVNYSYEDLKPSVLSNKYDVFITYDYSEWLETHSKNELFKKERCPGVTFYVPLVILNEVDKSIPKDIFEEIQNMAAPIISLRFLPVGYFSVVIDT